MTASTSSSPVPWTAAAGYEKRRRRGGRTGGRTDDRLVYLDPTSLSGRPRRRTKNVDGGGVMGLLKSHQCHSDQRGTLCLPSVRQLKKSSSGVGGNVCSTQHVGIPPDRLTNKNRPSRISFVKKRGEGVPCNVNKEFVCYSGGDGRHGPTPPSS